MFPTLDGSSTAIIAAAQPVHQRGFPSWQEIAAPRAQGAGFHQQLDSRIAQGRKYAG
jgi:hypothetical protein